MDVVTYDGDGINGKKVSHSLGAVPGMMIFKKTNDSGSWVVYHKETEPTLSYIFMKTMRQQQIIRRCLMVQILQTLTLP